ncbi:MAG: hypothetical protein EXS50_00635 [Candidatus Taylorbacteria bacterium]|nr:hypothetical protein [Candidatus Taylorbacteria bacterium]
MKEKFLPVTPKRIKMFGMPFWFNHHGTKVSYIGFNNANSPKRIMLLESSTIKIQISSNHPKTGYILSYTITHSLDTSNTGKIWMSKEDLEAAFGINDKCEAFGGQWLADEYGADVAHQGKYIRYGIFLNIPGPGTGADGDPNVSIQVSANMIEMIKSILFR